jgi:hypothetical protein
MRVTQVGSLVIRAGMLVIRVGMLVIRVGGYHHHAITGLVHVTTLVVVVLLVMVFLILQGVEGVDHHHYHPSN